MAIVDFDHNCVGLKLTTPDRLRDTHITIFVLVMFGFNVNYMSRNRPMCIIYVVPCWRNVALDERICSGLQGCSVWTVQS